MEEDSHSTPDHTDDEAGPFIPPDIEGLDAVLDEYEFIGKLGQGGMGAVYEGRQKSINRPVAIRVSNCPWS